MDPVLMQEGSSGPNLALKQTFSCLACKFVAAHLPTPSPLVHHVEVKGELRKTSDGIPAVSFLHFVSPRAPPVA
jgi:hypothetical protein